MRFVAPALRKTTISIASLGLVGTGFIAVAPATQAVTVNPATASSSAPAQRAEARASTRAARVAAMRVSAKRIAKAQVGKSYVAAAAGPSAFDCSGLTKYVYRKAFGRNLPHYSYSQWRMGKRVSVRNARVGDLVFYFKYGTHHVGIYIGHGKMVHAANPQSDVKVSRILDGGWYSTHFSGIRRIVG